MKKTMLEKVNEYIQYKLRLGIEMKHDIYGLRSFGKFMDLHYPNEPLTIKYARLWVESSQIASRLTYAKRIGLIRPLSKYLAIDDDRMEYIPTGIYGSSHSRIEPYIYKKEECVRILTVNPYIKHSPIRLLTLRTILGLLMCTGMRVGEALALKRQHIDMTNNTISIYRSKRKYLRTIPVDITVTAKLREYAVERDKSFPITDNTYLFHSTDDRHEHYFYRRIEYIWHTLLQKANVGQDRLNTPRIHDLRHTFACNYLIRAYEENLNIDIAVYRLSRYLGHSHISDTYWYLSAVPILLKICNERFERQMDMNYKENDT